ncbi:MAG: EamA family transporter [Firmicutes bacterium]|nr:EamA family transporter [Bacillota bacterium]
MKTQYGKYIASLLIFGTNGVVASFLTLNNTAIIFYRTVVGSLFLLSILLLTRKLPKPDVLKGQLLPVSVSGATLGLGWLFLFEAYRQIGVGTSTLLYYLGPALFMILAPILFKERITLSRILGITAAFAGMILVNFNLLGSDAEGSSFYGVLCGLASALMYAVMLVANKKVTRLDGVDRTFFQLIFAGIVVTLYALLTQKPLWPIQPSELLPLLILCMVNTGLGCYFYFSSTHLLPVQSVAVLSYIDPLSALVFSAIFLNECMGTLQIIGAALILGGAAFGELYRPKHKGGQS